MKSSGMPGLWFAWFRKYSKKAGFPLGNAHGLDHRVVEARVGLRVRRVFQVGLVQHLPMRDLVVVAGIVALAELVRESTLRVPGEEPRVVVRDLLEARVARRAPLRVGPGHPVRIVGIRDGLVALVQPRGDRAEVEDHRVALGRFQEVDGHGIDEREIPRRLPVLRRFQLRHAELRVRKPRHVADILGLKVAQGLEGVVVHRRPAPERRVHHDLQRRGRLGDPRDLVPARGDLARRVRRGGRVDGDRREDQDEKGQAALLFHDRPPTRRESDVRTGATMPPGRRGSCRSRR
jgi:hypothetical protein